MDAALARPNQQVQLGPVRVTPIAVLKDQRCIEDPIVGCPIASITVVRLLVEQEGKVGWLDVPSGGMERWGNQAIAFASIKPERRSRIPIPNSAYQTSIRRIPADLRIIE